MSKSQKSLIAALGLSAGLAVGSGSVSAAAANFCNDGDECIPVYVENNASATVTSVNMTQERGDESCEGGLKKTVSRNSAGGTGIDPGQSFRFNANPICKYKIVYKTTKACTGDKTVHIRPKDFENTYDVVQLKNACGTLKARIARFKSPRN